MALKSVIDIAVNDGEFQAFKAAFDKYNAALSKTPAAWKKVTAEAAVTEKEIKRTSLALRDEEHSLGNVAKTQAGMTKSTADFAGMWKSLGRNTMSFASNIERITGSILKWGGVFAAGSALMAGGGLFGITRLAEHNAERRKNANGLGTTVGAESAFVNNASRFLDDPQGLLQGVFDAKHFASERVNLISAGLSDQEINQKDPVDVAISAMRKAKSFAENYDDESTLGTAMHAQKFDALGISVQDALRFKNNPAEFERQIAHIRDDRKTGNVTDDKLQAWTDLDTQLHRTGLNLDATFSDKLTPVASAFTNLSAAINHDVDAFAATPKIKELLDEAATGINDFAKELDSPEFRQHVTEFSDNLDTLAIASGVAATALTAFSVTQGVRSLLGRGAKEVIKDAPLEAEEAGLAATLMRYAGPIGAFLWGMRPYSTQTDAQEQEAMKGGPGTWREPQPEDTLADKAKRAWDRMRGNDPWTDPEDKFGIPHGGLSALERQESGGRDVEGPMTPWGTAKGYAQFMDATARAYGVNVHDEKSSMYGSGNYLSDLHKQWGSWDKTLAAYNGAGRLKEIIDKWGDNWREHTKPETQKYLNSVGPAFGVAQQRIKVDVSINGATPGTNPTASAAVVAH